MDGPAPTACGGGENRVTDDRFERAALRAEIETLVVENAFLLDRGRFAELIELYTEDCEVTRPLPPFSDGRHDTVRGRPALAKSFADPAAWPPNPRTMRHVLANLRLEARSANEVAATLTWTGYRHEGEGLSASIPMAVGDYEDEYFRDGNGRWRIRKRRIVIAFLNRDLLEQATAATRGKAG
jgi:3-phenylpropionate/cinnamic acid dioxygenase small subunit